MGEGWGFVYDKVVRAAVIGEGWGFVYDKVVRAAVMGVIRTN